MSFISSFSSENGLESASNTIDLASANVLTCLFSYSNPHAAQQQNSGSAQPGEDLTPDYMNVLVNIFKNLKLLTPTHKARLSKDATKKPQYKNILAL